MQSPRTRTFLSVVLFILISLFLIYWRIPRDASSSKEGIRTAFVLSAFVFLLSVPCFYLIFRTVFGKFLGLLFSVFYVLLAVFPYKLFYGPEVKLSNICFHPAPTTIFGLSGIWVLIFYFTVSLFVTSAYWFYKTQKFFPVIAKKQLSIFILLLLAALIQIGPRLGKNSPKCVKRNLHRDGIFTNIRTTKFHGFEITERNLHKDDVVTNIRTTKFYGFETGGNDVFHHVVPSGMFKGVFKGCKNYAVNRRGLTPYLYSLISTYFHPYYATIIINGIFYYIILVSGYLLAKHLGLSESIAVAYSILLSANYFILFYTIMAYFYLQYSVFIMLILLLIFRLQIFETPWQVSRQLLFCSVLACSGLTYDPFVFSGIVLVWGFFHSIRTLGTNIKKSLGTIVQSLVFAVVPICSQHLWEMLLRFYHLQGLPKNTQIRAALFDKLLLLPSFIYTNFLECGAIASRIIVKLVVENPILAVDDPIETQIEYWFLLGMLGVFSFFVLLPKYVSKEHRQGLYACYISNLGLSFVTSLAAAIPPLMRYHYIFISEARTNYAYPVLILAQSIGIYHITKVCCDKLKIGKEGTVVVGIAVCIYMLSFVKMLFL